MTIDLDPGTHVVLGTGQLGRPVATALLERGADVRLVNRSGTVPGAFSDDVEGRVECLGADISDLEAAREACAGAAVVYCCLQAPYADWREQFPPLLDGAIEGAAAADARFVMADNLYSYGRTEEHVTEDLPDAATSGKGRTRAAMAETILAAHEAGRIEATIGRASDFYGPGVRDSMLGERAFPAILDGGSVWFPGDPDAPHTYTYVRDFARALLVLGAEERALGEVWHVPSAETLTTREIVSLAGDIAGTGPRVRRAPQWLVRALSVVISPLKEIGEMRYLYDEPFVVSHEKFADAFELEPTPHREALEETLAWYEAQD